MPLIIKTTLDLFELQSSVDYITNPTNLFGVAGAGLALEFKRRVPEFFEPYRQACRSKELRIGTVHVFEDTNKSWGIINFPTKRHYQDTSDPQDIIRGLEALRDLLNTDKFRYASVVMPMLGCGLGKQDYDVVYPMMIDHLSNLDATIILSMSPERTEMRPRYLTIVGPPTFTVEGDDQKVVEETIDKVMTAWGKDLSEYAGIISGGYPGIDQFVCGSDFNKGYEDTLVYKKTGQIPLVVKPNKQRNGVTANLTHNDLLCELADDIILFKPKGHNNNRMSAMQTWLNEDKKARILRSVPPRRVAIFGEHEVTAIQEPVLIPVESGDDF